MSMYSLLIEPILTEKSNILRTDPKGTDKRYYVFKVRQDTNKIELIKAVEKIFNVHPLDCKIINVKPKKKNRKMSKRGYTRKYKKAIIVLDGKDNIDILK